MNKINNMSDLVFEVWLALVCASDAMMDLENSEDPSRNILICDLKDAIDSCGSLIGKIEDIS